MSGAKSNLEVEIKLPLESVAQGRRLLRAAGFRLARRRGLERNLVFDTPDQSLRSRARLLRLRQYGKDVLLTYKGTPEPGRHKRREELEIAVSDPELCAEILERLGLAASFIYEKYRAVYRQPDARGVAVLDETPIGVYLELEGSARWIDATARRLGFREQDYVTASYGGLFLEHCRQQGIVSNAMVFQGGRR